MADHQDAGRARRAKQTLEELQASFLERSARLADMMLQGAEAVSVKHWRRYAKKAPDRHFQGLSIVSKLGGLNQPEKVQIDIKGFILQLQATCDADLERSFGVTSPPPRVLVSGGPARSDP